MKNISRNLLSNGRFENQTLDSWDTTIEDIKLEPVKNPPAAYSLYMPVDKYIQQKISTPVPSEGFLLGGGCRARVDVPAHMGSVVTFTVLSYFENDPIPAATTWGFLLNSEWNNFWYERPGLFRPNIIEMYLLVANSGWISSDGEEFNAPLQITDIGLNLV